MQPSNPLACNFSTEDKASMANDVISLHQNVQIKNVDMNQSMQERIIELAKEICKKENNARQISGIIKKECDRLFGPVWHCIVGKSYGSYVTHESQHFIFFYVDSWAIMVFKTS